MALSSESSTDAGSGPAVDPGFALTEEQVRFFELFGFVALPGLFSAPEVERMTAGFESAFASRPAIEYRHALHYGELRQMVGPGFADTNEDLAWLRSDPRVLGIVRSVIGDDFEYAESDGNRFHCDTGWHSDILGAPLDQLHVKLYFYLDPLRHDTGALRVIPGTNTASDRYGRDLRGLFWEVDGPERAFGLDARSIPSWTVETQPGDLVVGDFRTLHATFGGAPGRRLMTINYRETRREAPAEPSSSS